MTLILNELSHFISIFVSCFFIRLKVFWLWICVTADRISLQKLFLRATQHSISIVPRKLIIKGQYRNAQQMALIKMIMKS